MEYQIVIARYNEDIRYLLNYSNISIVYNKGDEKIPLDFNYINLPNVGRESHTYLYHIITNYDNLANKTLFIQGNIKDHKLYPLNDYLYNKDSFFGKKSTHPIDFLKNHIKHSGKYLKELKSGNLKKSKYTPYEWINLIGIDITQINDFEMVWGANFSVSKDLIHKKPKIFYENIIKYLEYDKNPEEGHYFERSWNLIFNHPIFLEKKIILYNFLNIDKNIIDKYKNILELNNIEEIHLWNNIIDKNIKKKYTNNSEYVSIYKNIVNMSFSFKINNNLNILLNFKNKKYEFLFEINNDNIKIIDYDNDNKEIFLNLKINSFLDYYLISWKNNDLKLIYNNNLIFNIQLELINNLIDIQIKNNSDIIIDYNTEKNQNINGDSSLFSELKEENRKSELNIFNMINYNNSINKNFYRNNFENYYSKSLKEFILDKNFII